MFGHTYAVENHGTIVTLWVKVSPDDPSEFRLWPVHFDHRQFQHLVDGRGDRGILGQNVEVFDDPELGPTVQFQDEEASDTGCCDICGGDCGESHRLVF